MLCNNNVKPVNKLSLKDLLAELQQLLSQTTFKDYLVSQVLRYPALYATSSAQESSLLLMDQVLNTNGNGMQSDRQAAESLVYSLRLAVENKKSNDLVFEEILQSNDIVFYCGFTQEQIENDKKWKRPLRPGVNPEEVMPLGEPKLQLFSTEYFRQLEKGSLPSYIAKWFQDHKNYSCKELKRRVQQRKISNLGHDLKLTLDMFPLFDPYPNFSYEYSFLYCSPKVSSLLIKNESWKDAIVTYYQECQKYFKDPFMHFEYHTAYPEPVHLMAEIQRNSLETSFLEAFKKYNSHEKISKEYGQPYNGNIQEFLTVRWAKEKQRIEDFIQDTIFRVSSEKEFLFKAPFKST